MEDKVVTIRVCTQEVRKNGETFYTVVDSVGHNGVLTEKALIKDYTEGLPRSVPNLKVIKRDGHSGTRVEDYTVKYTPLEIRGLNKKRENECLLPEGIIKMIVQEPSVKLFVNADIDAVRQKVKMMGIPIKCDKDYIIVGEKKDTRIYTNQEVFSTAHLVDVFSYLNNRHIELNFKRKELNFGKVMDFSGMFDHSIIPNEALEGLNCSGAVSAVAMFSHVQTGVLDVSKLDFSNARFVERMFSGVQCKALIASNDTFRNAASGISMFTDLDTDTLDIRNLNTTGMISMADMFRACTSRNGIDVSNLNTKFCEDMSGMFQACNSQITGIENLDTSNVINMARMFSEFKSDRLDISRFDVSRVRNITEMFQDCNIRELDMRGLELKSVRIANNMFNKAKIGKVILNPSQRRLADMLRVWSEAEIVYMG